MTTVIAELPYRPQDPTRQSFSWATDIMKAYDGTEHRMALRTKPRQSLGYQYLLDDEETRQVRAQLYNDTDSFWLVPLWHEPITLTSDIASGATVLPGDFSTSDIQTNQSIYLEHADGTRGEFIQAGVVSDPQIVTTVGTSDGYLTGSLIYPAILCRMSDSTPMAQMRWGFGQFNLSTVAAEFWPLGGKGATLSTYQGKTFLDKEPIVRGSVRENYDRRIETIDYGMIPTVSTGTSRADASRGQMFLIQSRLDLQYWKLFGDTVLGRRGSFYAPTWRDDLELSEPAVGGASFIRVQEAPDFKTRWFEAGSTHVDIQLETDVGVIQRRVMTAIDGGTTTTLNLDVTLPGGLTSVNRVSFVQLVRLGSDTISFNHKSTYSTVSLSLRTVENGTVSV